MTDFSKCALNGLKECEKRITAPRKMLISILEKTDIPLSPYKIQEKLKNLNFEIDVATIYRNLEHLQSMGLVHYIRSDRGFIRCRCLNDEGSHIFLKCAKCKKIFEKSVQYKGEMEVFFRRNIRQVISSVYIEVDIVCEQCL